MSNFGSVVLFLFGIAFPIAVIAAVFAATVL